MSWNYGVARLGPRPGGIPEVLSGNGISLEARVIVDFGSGNGFAIQEALSDIAAVVPNERILSGSLDSFRDRDDPKVLGQADNRTNDGGVVRTAGDPFNERLVDL